MTDITTLESDIQRELVAAEASQTPFSWSAAIVGALAATAVSFLVIALGSGIGLSFASPYGSGPSVTNLTIAAAVWLVMAQTMGFASGGYLAARLRSPARDEVLGGTMFRDAAQGFVVWALGVVVTAIVIVALGMFAAATASWLAAGAARGDSAASLSEAATTTQVGYFVDLMLRPASAMATVGGQGPSSSETVGAAGSAPAQSTTLNAEIRPEVTRVLLRAVSRAGLDDDDRAYLSHVVSARTGLPPDEAQRRVAMAEIKAQAAIKEAADKSAKAGAFFSFWMFMSLLFGGSAATLAGILGGQLRDAELQRTQIG